MAFLWGAFDIGRFVAPPSLQISLIRVLPKDGAAYNPNQLPEFPAPAGIDVTVNNSGDQPVILDHVTLDIRGSQQLTTHEEPGLLSRCGAAVLPITTGPSGPAPMEYQAVWKAGQARIATEMRDVVQPTSLDRFQVFIQAEPSLAEEEDCIVAFRLSFVVDVSYNHGHVANNRVISAVVPLFDGLPRGTGLTIGDKARLMLKSDSIQVVESMAGALASVGGPEAVTALQTLEARNLDYLQDGGSAAPSPELMELQKLLQDAVSQAGG